MISEKKKIRKNSLTRGNEEILDLWLIINLWPEYQIPIRVKIEETPQPLLLLNFDFNFLKIRSIIIKFSFLFTTTTSFKLFCNAF